MVDDAHRDAPNIIQFVSQEHENFLIALVRDREFFAPQFELQGFYTAAIKEVEGRDGDLPLVQLILFLHFHFLFASACFARCHLSAAFASSRAAIDAALIGAYIIRDRQAGEAYVKREPPFDNFARHLGNLIKANKPLPHPLVRPLFELQKKLSQFSVHADIGSFIHRAKIIRNADEDELQFQYFQLVEDNTRRKIYGLQLLLAFVLVLDMFSDFLVAEQMCLSVAWQNHLRSLGARLEVTLEEAKTALGKSGG